MTATSSTSLGGTSLDALADPRETHLSKPWGHVTRNVAEMADPPSQRSGPAPPPGPAWTHRFKSSGEPARYELYDQIWLSPPLAARQTAAWIDRRTKHSGDGSDHDPPGWS